MKKVLALVLALTMVLGFAATASASFNYDGRYFKYDMFQTEPTDASYDVGGMGYDDDMSVEGNKEYTVKLNFTSADLHPNFLSEATSVNNLAQEILVLDLIERYAADPIGKDWDVTEVQTPGSSALADDVFALVTPSGTLAAASPIFADLVAAFSASNDTLYKAVNSAAFRTAARQLRNDYQLQNNGIYGYDKGIVAYATSKDTTYATITSDPVVKVTYNGGNDANYEVSFKVRFTNTTFRTADVDIELVLQSGINSYDAYFEFKDTLSFTVFQAQYRTFTEQDALIAFGVTPNVEISADDYAYISADAFRLMLQNSSRSITVVSGMGDSKVRFDKDSTNLPQDVFVGNFTTSANSDSVSINGFSSTTSAKIKIAVGRSFYNANNGKVISVYDANGNKLDVEATLQGDYTVNFYAPLSNYTVAGADWAGQTVPSTDAGKNNPSMGGAF